MEFLILALLRGASYLLVALGFALVFGAGRVLNLSHGALYLVAAYVAYWIAAQDVVEAGPLLAYGAAIAVTVVLGMLLFQFIIRPGARSPNRTMVLCLALNFALTETLRATFGAQGILVPSLLPGRVDLAGVTVPQQLLLVVPVAAFLLAGTAAVLYRTRAGRAVRAVAQDPEAAETIGISSMSVLGWTFAASAGMAALAACIVAPSTVLGPWGWISPLVKSFAVVVLGGIRHLGGTVAAALVLASAEVATAFWISEGAAEYVSLVVIVIVLIARPGGILIEGDR